MARRAKNPSLLMKWRLNQNIKTAMLVEKTGLSPQMIYRIERGEAMARVRVATYLGYWGGNLNNVQMFPEKLQIIDEGWAVRLRFGD